MIKIKIWGTIGLQTSNVVETALSNIKNNDEPVIIVINSVGGTLSDSIAICNLLKSIQNPIITIALGSCASAAAMIFSCGHSRYIGEDVAYMIHQPLIQVIDEYQNSTNVKKKKQKLDHCMKIYKKYTLKNTNIPQDKLNKAFKDGEDLYLSHTECIKYNIATSLFTTWQKLYEKEKISIDDEQILLFDVLMQETEDL